MAEPIRLEVSDCPFKVGDKIELLSEEEIDLMNKVKQAGNELGKIVELLRQYSEIDQRWVSIGATDLQTGLMALTRAIAKPSSF